MLSARLLIVASLTFLSSVGLLSVAGATSAVTGIWVPAAFSAIAGYKGRGFGVLAACIVTAASLLLFRHQLDGVAIGLLSLQQLLIAIAGYCYRNTVAGSGSAIALDLFPAELQTQGSTILAVIAATLCGAAAGLFSDVFNSAPVEAALGLSLSGLLAILLILPMVLVGGEFRGARFPVLLAVGVGTLAVPLRVNTAADMAVISLASVWLLAACISLYGMPVVAAGLLAGLAIGVVLTEVVWPGQFGLDEQAGTVLLALFVLLILHKLHTLRVTQLQQSETIDRRSTRIRYLLKQRDEVTALAVHDLQSPLQAIGGLLKTLLHMIEQKRDNPVESRSALQSAIGSLEEMSQRVASVLSESRSHLGGSATLSSLRHVIGQVVAAHQPELGRRQLEVSRVDDSTLRINDAEEVKDILDVLLDNAIQHSPVRGVIVIDCRLVADANKIVIDVSDDGSGVNPTEIGNLFKVDAASANRQGIGLYLAHQRARLIGGAIHYIEGGATGACFRLSLPIAK